MTITWSTTTLVDPAPSFVWGHLTPVTDQGDVDFVYVASEEFPMRVSAETARAIPALASVISGP